VLRVWGEGLCSASLIELDRGSMPSGVFRPVGTAYGSRHSRGGERLRVSWGHKVGSIIGSS